MKKFTAILLLIIGSLSAADLLALNPYGYETYAHHGHVFARGIVTDSSGKPRWAEYNRDGGHVELKQFSGTKGFVISGSALRNYQSVFQEFRERLKGKVEVYNYQQFKDAEILTVDDRKITDLPKLKDKNGSIIIAGKEKRYSDDGSQLEHYIFPIDIGNLPEIGTNILSVLFSEDGDYLHSGEDRIGLLTAYYTKGPDHYVESSQEYQVAPTLKRLYDDKEGINVINPISGVFIDAWDGYLNAATTSESTGQYTLKGLLPPCPGFSYFKKLDAYAHLQYSNFNPKGRPSLNYYLKKRSYNNCVGYGAVPIATDIVSSAARNQVIGTIHERPGNHSTLNYPVAVNVISGRVVIPGVTVTENDTPTTYEAETSPKDLFIVKDDYDGDGKVDDVSRGMINDEGKFEASANGNRYGVFFSSGKREDGQPDLIRVMDVSPHLSHEGMLKTITKDDLKDTDILIFREATGELITERKGMPGDEVQDISVGDIDLDRQQNLGYRMAIRSVDDLSSTKRYGYKDFIDWQAKTKMNPELQKFNADFIRTGEKLRIVVINRTTGYIGTETVELHTNNQFGDITLRVPVIELAPPNLRVWATRRVKSHGLLKNSDEERYTISNESAATTDDVVVELHTEWLDQDGYPLPIGLKSLGYTGRLAKQISSGSGNIYNDAKEFAIDPGRNLQVLELDGNEPFHYYLQVNGKMDAEQNDFSAGNHTGELRHRPNKYVPVRVPLYDEQGTIDDRLAIAKVEPKEGEDKIKESDVPSRFDWVIRPEYSFSMIDIAVNEIQLKGEEDDAEPINILDDETPVISSSDDLVKVLFNLIGSEYERITPIDGDRQYIFALGESEIEVKISKGDAEDKTVEFTNLDHLAQLDVEDYLTLSLYLNQDSQNVLWEWGFDSKLIVETSEDAGSRAAMSFIMCSSEDQANNSCDKQQKILAWVSTSYPDETPITWTIEALPGSSCNQDGKKCPGDDLPSGDGDSNKNSTSGSGSANKPYAYGKVKDVQVGAHRGSYQSPGTSSGSGEFKNKLTIQGRIADARYLTFNPDVDAHLTKTYREKSCGSNQFGYCLSGTNGTDVWRHNPHVGYKVTVKVGDNKTEEETIKMDERDVLRQEYINHLSSASVAASKGVVVPGRDKIVVVPDGDWVDRVGYDGRGAYPYGVMVDESMSSMLTHLRTVFATHINNPVTLDNGTQITWPTGATIEVTSGYRNPERNERVSSAQGSRHMLGRALDLAIRNVNSHDKAKAYYILWEVITANPPAEADIIAYEDKPAHWFYTVSRAGNWSNPSPKEPWVDRDRLPTGNPDGIPDGFDLVSHVHIQDNP